ncbi:MAG: PaaI family thioesterase [Bdellovibrionales bacterium]|nr:PaaI family thioesterase [Bdellovibrionales bacterium]
MTRQEKNIETLWGVWREKYTCTLMGSVGMELDHIGVGGVRGRMAIGPQVHQLYGMLHGGASVAFAETLCSVGAYVHINGDTHYCVGLEINANHVRGAVQGMAHGEARPVHIGKSTQVWQIEIRNEEGKLLCTSRCTVAVVPKE